MSELLFFLPFRLLLNRPSQLKELLLELQESACLESSVSSLFSELAPDMASLPEPNGTAHETAYLKSILRMPSRTYDLEADSDAIAKTNEDLPANYFDSMFEDEYLANLDSQLSDPVIFHDPTKPLQIPASRKLPSDKDLANQNQDSVVSWLRRNHPESFIQDIDKPPPKPRGKRASLVAAKIEHELGDDEVPDHHEKPSRGKKNKDDEAYRPKGGSSRSTKRKREDGEHKGPGRGKRSKLQASP
jgi:hypothetical protein